MKLLRWFNRASLENPKTSLANPAAWLWEALGAHTSQAGLSVTPENSLETSTVWAAVRMISSTVATLPLPVYCYTTDGKEKARSHPNWTLLHDRPNPEMSGFVWRELVMAHLLLYGNSYNEIERNGKGDPVALWPLHPSQVRVERRGTERVYVVTVNSQAVPLSYDAMLHIQGFSLDGLAGLIPTSLARNAIGLAKATEQFGSAFFSQGAAPSGVLEHPGKLGKDAADRLREAWTATQAGLTNAQRIAVLEEGMKWSPLGIPPEHAQFLETRKFQVSEVARVFLIPPHLIGDLERATFSNIEQQSLEYVTRCIEPWTRRIESELNWQLFGDRSEFFCEFVLEGLLRGDSASRAAFYTALFNIGVLSPNEIRARENMNAVEGGDQRFIPLNMTSLEAAQPTDTVTGAVRAVIDAEVGRYVRRKHKQLERGKLDEDFYRQQRDILNANLASVLTAYARLTNSDETPDAFIDRILNDEI